MVAKGDQTYEGELGKPRKRVKEGEGIDFETGERGLVVPNESRRGFIYMGFGWGIFVALFTT